MLPTLRLLDVACGHLRYLQQLISGGEYRYHNIDVWGVDSCDELVDYGVRHGHVYKMQFHYQHLDISQSLLEGVDLSSAIEAPLCDFTVCFAFMHHLPLASQRRDLLRALVEHTRPGGCIAVSFWQFLDDSRLVGKAQTFAGAGPGDYLLGWPGRTNVARFCHHCEEKEIDELVASVADLAKETRRYSSDGRTGRLNCYVLLERKRHRLFGGV